MVDVRVRRLDMLVRVLDIRGPHSEVVDQHGARSADHALRPSEFRKSSEGRLGEGQRHAAPSIATRG